MSQFYKENPSLLNNLNVKQINQLLLDDSLENSGFSVISYGLDTYDLVEYCIPSFFSKVINTKSSFEYNSDLIITYNYIFNQFESKPIVFDEYLTELFSIENKLINKISVVEKFWKNLTKLSSVKGEFSRKDDSIFNETLKNIGTVSAFAILLRDGDDIHKRYTDAIKNKLQIKEFKNERFSKYNQEITQIFKDTGKSDLTNEIFDAFTNEIYPYLSSIESDIQRFYYLDNAYRDIIVIDRLININKKLISRGHKMLIYYLSSTPFKSKTIFNLEVVQKNLPIVAGKSINFLRSNAQLFLQKLLKTYVAKTKEETYRSFLLQAKKVSEQYDLLRRERKNKYSFNNKISELFNSENLRKEMRDTLLFYEEIDSLSNTFSKELLDENEDKAQVIKAFLKKYKAIKKNTLKYSKKIEKRPRLMLNYAGQNYLLHTTIIRFLKVKEKENIKIEIQTGADIVKSNFQHLPILVFYKSKKLQKHWKKLIKIFSEFISSPIENRPSIIENITDEIKIFIKKEKKSSLSIVQSNILIAFLNLIYPDIHESNGKRVKNSQINREKIIISYLEPMVKTIESSFSKSVIKKNQENYFLSREFAPEKGGIYLEEIYYLLIWLYRRSNSDNYLEKIRTIIDQDSYNSNPRLLHGYGLALVNKAYDNLKSKQLSFASNFFLEGLKYIEKSKELYELKESEPQPEYRDLFNKTIVALFNTLADCNIKLHEIEKQLEYSFGDNKRLIISRYFINQIKERLNDEYNKHPTINHTEADLEYLESLYFLEKNEYKNAYDKISAAKRRIELIQGQNYKYNQHLYSITYDKIDRLENSTEFISYKNLPSL